MYAFFYYIIDAISSLALSSNNQNKFITGEGDCSELLVRILHQYKDRADVCISVCSAIFNLTRQAPSNQNSFSKVVIKKGFFGFGLVNFGDDKLANLLIDIYKKYTDYSNNTVLCEHLCGVIANLADEKFNENNKWNREQFIKAKLPMHVVLEKAQKRAKEVGSRDSSNRAAAGSGDSSNRAAAGSGDSSNRAAAGSGDSSNRAAAGSKDSSNRGAVGSGDSSNTV